MAKKVYVTQDAVDETKWLAFCEACSAWFEDQSKAGASKQGHDHFKAEHSKEEVNRSNVPSRY